MTTGNPQHPILPGGRTHAHRHPDRRRRLPGPQRGDPRRGPQGHRRARRRVRRLPRRLARRARGRHRAAWTSPRCAASCRAAAPILGTSRTNPYGVEGGAGPGAWPPSSGWASTRSSRSAARTPSASPPSSPRPASAWSACPKTIDNDLDSTDYTFGFDTAVGIAMEAIDRLHTTGDSHHRTLVVEVMGRHAGWIALHAGMAGGANVILIPEKPVRRRRRRRALPAAGSTRGYSPIIVVSEGATPKDGDMVLRRRGRRTPSGTCGSAASATALASLIEERTGREARAVVLGHVQRGGTPSPFDRVLATRFGLAAVDAVHDGQSGRDGGAARHRHRAGAAGRRPPRS